MTHRCVAFALVLSAWIPALLAGDKFTPTSQYKELRIGNHVVLLHPELEKHPKEKQGVTDQLKSQLEKMGKALGRKHLAELEKVRIWVEWNANPKAAAVFHPHPGWLKNNGYNPDKANGIEICHTANFIRWSNNGQPWMLMHEFAHVYHENILKNKDEKIQKAYQRAMKAKLYDSVADLSGKKVRAYAATDSYEFFAEMTETYLGKNDFFPFTREELQQHDPDTHDLMRNIWGK